MGEEEEKASRSQFYDVDKFKDVVDSQQSTQPPNGARLVFVRMRSFLDSMLGLVSTFIFMMIVFAAPVVIIIGILYGLLGFLISFGGVIGGLGFYANRRLGKSAQFGDGNVGVQILAQLAGCSMVVLIAYLLLFLVFRIRV